MTADQEDTRRSSYFTTVRRMKAEKERGIPISQRSSVSTSAQNGKSVGDMSEIEWEEFYGALCNVLKEDYPEQYNELFGS
jgi:hypothetical protein